MRQWVRIAHIMAIFLMVNAVFAAEGANNKHIVVFDAGSTSTRVHVYRVEAADQSKLVHLVELPSTEHDETMVGMDVYEGNTSAAGESLNILIDSAVSKIEHDSGNAKSTPTYFYATAGMRLLQTRNEKAENEIYNSVRKALQPRLQVKEVKTITGQWEGVYNWVGINFLYGTFDSGQPTFGALDMGGASTQITFAQTSVSSSDDSILITLGGKNYNLYSHSFLGLGQNQVALRLKETGVCYPADTPKIDNPRFSYPLCSRATDDLVQQFDVRAIVDKIPKNTSFIASSGFYYVSDFFDAENEPMPLKTLNTTIKTNCKKKYGELQSTHPNISQQYLRQFCMAGVYQLSLLIDGYGFSENVSNKRLRIIHDIQTAHGKYKVTWAIGAAVLHASGDDYFKNNAAREVRTGFV